MFPLKKKKQKSARMTASGKALFPPKKKQIRTTTNMATAGTAAVSVANNTPKTKASFREPIQLPFSVRPPTDSERLHYGQLGQYEKGYEGQEKDVLKPHGYFGSFHAKTAKTLLSLHTKKQESGIKSNSELLDAQLNVLCLAPAVECGENIYAGLVKGKEFYDFRAGCQKHPNGSKILQERMEELSPGETDFKFWHVDDARVSLFNELEGTKRAIAKYQIASAKITVLLEEDRNRDVSM